MSHRLLARNSHHYLSPLTVVNRLKAEFPYVETDSEEGHRHVVETMDRLQANRWAKLFDVNRTYLEHLERVKERAIYVCFGDNPGADWSVLSTYVIPSTPLEFQYISLAHEQSLEPLLLRCASALEYDIVKDRRMVADPGFDGRERRRFLDRRSMKDRRNPR